MRQNTGKSFCHCYPSDVLVKENREVVVGTQRLCFAVKAVEASGIPHISPSWVPIQNL